MCGRFTLVSDLDLILHRFNLAYTDVEYIPRYNAGPYEDNNPQMTLAITNDDGSYKISKYRWGLQPYRRYMFNAKAETVDQLKSYKDAFRRRRCIIPVDGFIEWKGTKGNKTPLRIHLKDQEIFGLAGIWNQWTMQGEPVRWCSIITTEPNKFMEPIHDRMPVILRKEDEEAWLDPGNQDPLYLKHMLQQYPSEKMTSYKIPKLVNNPRFDRPECIEPV